MRLLYKPFGLILGVVSGLIATRIFNWVWQKFDDAEPPKGTAPDSTWPKVLAAAALQGMIFKGVRSLADRSGAAGFNYLTGTWPEKRRT